MLKWTFHGAKETDSHYRYRSGGQYAVTVSRFVSIDGGAWEPDEFTSRWKPYSEPTGKKAIVEEAILQGRKEKQKERSRQVARERRAALEADAAKLGISPKELEERRKAERLAKNPHKVTKQDIDRTRRIMAVAPSLRDLKDEVEALLTLMETEPKKVHITHIDRNVKYIREVIGTLHYWGTAKKDKK